MRALEVISKESNFIQSELYKNSLLYSKRNDEVFYKERWIKENGIEQRLIVTFSPKYQEYRKHIREKQISRAKK